MAKETVETAIATRPRFALLQQDAGSITEMLKQNLAGQSIGPNDLERVKIPSGGGTMWTIPSVEGDQEAKEFTGIIVAFRTVRGFWRAEYSGESNPPDCFSDDGINGHGDPGVQCATCPFNQWDSADKDTGGKACKERRLVFVLRQGDLLPIVVSLSPGSLKNFTKYLLRLTQSGIPYYEAMTRFWLEPDKNKKGIKFSKASLAMVGRLEAAEAAAVKDYAETIKPIIAKIRDEEMAIDAQYGDAA